MDKRGDFYRSQRQDEVHSQLNTFDRCRSFLIIARLVCAHQMYSLSYSLFLLSFASLGRSNFAGDENFAGAIDSFL